MLGNEPDLRLGQLMTIILSAYAAETGRDPFFPEDEEFVSFIERKFISCGGSL